MSEKVTAILHWLDPLLREHTQGPFVLGVSGVQGSGKSTLVERLQETLQSRGLCVAQMSLDDFYLDHAGLSRLARDGGNTLWASRGQFGTHDVPLARDVFRAFRSSGRDVVEIPRFDKSLFAGQGDRMGREEWTRVYGPVDIVIFEGWGVGFEAVSRELLVELYERAKKSGQKTGMRRFEEIEMVNDALREYNELFMGTQHFDGMVVLQAKETDLVYKWRLEQEHAMWKVKGRGMTDEEVGAFIDRYYPSYELYLPRSIAGFFGKDKEGHQLNLKMDAARTIMGLEVI